MSQSVLEFLIVQSRMILCLFIFLPLSSNSQGASDSLVKNSDLSLSQKTERIRSKRWQHFVPDLRLKVFLENVDDGRMMLRSSLGFIILLTFDRLSLLGVE